jgi:NAD(P)-dependent dehydrogenase (short-subunit alcohol dehydrogenase family)
VEVVKIKMSWLNLEEKIVIVTGAASGIGREIATVLAENDSNVVVADISQKGQDVISKLPG